jgi:SecD/SecF fusion protein
MKAVWLKTLFAIVVPVVLAAWIVYPPGQTIKKGIDLAGGTSLIYEIDTTGLSAVEQKDLALRMIEILRRRVDPGNIQNLVWRPHGNTRFEIQMPLANPQARARRTAYLTALNRLLEKNVLPSTILRSLRKPQEQRQADFETFAQGDPNRLRILTDLAAIFDQRMAAEQQADQLHSKVRELEEQLSNAGLSIAVIQARRFEWIKQDPNQLSKDLDAFLASQDPNADPNTRLLLNEYVATYRPYAQILDQLADRQSGLSVRYTQALRRLDRFILTSEQIETILEMPARAKERAQAIEALKVQFPDWADLIDQVVVAFDQYRPERGRLDDPADLQRMLKGAGVLEFRILPTRGAGVLSDEEIGTYINALATKGPKYASDQKYVWAEVENPQEWAGRADVIIGQFGKRVYVLASNLPNECMLHGGSLRQWKLERAYPTADQMGRRAIGFQLDEQGGVLFANLTGHNQDRPLCILLDGIAISAPTISARIYRSGIIEGTFTATQVMDMVNKLNAGSLPARLIEQPVSVRTIGPSLGEDNLRRSLKAGYVGLMIVVAGMLIYYLKAGAIAVAAMLMNLLITLAALVLIQATFTLAGIAGVILTIGMTLDANVLIYERIREEQAKGSGIGFAIKNGYKRAFTTILDSNLTTIIPAVILYLIATEEIKGFAIVLMLGLATNLYTGVYVTRLIFEWMLAHGLVKDRLTMLSLVPVAQIDWMRLRPVFVTLSGLAIIGGLWVFFTRDPVKNNKYDIEFTGGMSVQLNFKEGVNLTRQQVQDRLRQAAAGVSQAFASANVYSVGTTGRQFEITTTETNKTRASITFEPNQT